MATKAINLEGIDIKATQVIRQIAVVGPIHKVVPTSSQFAQASAPPVSAGPPSATNRPTLALLAACQLRCADPAAQDCSDEPVGEQRGDHVAELAGAAKGRQARRRVAAHAIG